MGRTPLANSYLREEDLRKPEFKEDLALQVCPTCGLSQLTKIVNPDLMFKQYLYVSSTTETFRDHCAELAKSASAVAHGREGDWVLDIASNDGCLLSQFQKLGMRVVGVDPAENLAAEANRAGIPTLCAYWSTEVAERLAREFGRPKIITATNVFAHVDDVHGFVSAIGHALAPQGIFVIECPYVMDFIERDEFDTAYHEHVSYMGVHPLRILMSRHGLELFDVEYFEHIHGGTIRAFIARANDYPVAPSVERYLKKEQTFGITDVARYDAFGKRVVANKQRLLELIRRLRADGRVIWAYGASAKGNTLMNYFGLTKADIPVAIDDNPKKWEWYTPGSHMRIAGIDELARSRVDYLLLLAWNFEAEIRRRCQAVSYSGGFILPVPTATIIERAVPTPNERKTCKL